MSTPVAHAQPHAKTQRPPKAAIISVHDVMPHTLPLVQELIDDYLSAFNPADIALLVVPGLDWSREQIKQLQDWQSTGFEIAGHGWVHEIVGIRDWHHQLHSWLLSRRAAEHLSQNSQALLALIQRNYHWFADNGLASPELYVPPAWAVGALSSRHLSSLPFAYMETTSGFIELASLTQHRLPLLGYEADAWQRVPLLWLWNQLNWSVATSTQPLRVSIHPQDHQYYLRHNLRNTLAEVKTVNYRTLFESSSTVIDSYG